MAWFRKHSKKDYIKCFDLVRALTNEPRKGLELAWGDGSPPYVSFRAGNALLSLFERRLMSEAINNSAKPYDAESQDKVAIILAVDDVDQTFYELKSKGVNFIMPPETRPGWGVRTAHLRDPDGNLIEINQIL